MKGDILNKIFMINEYRRKAEFFIFNRKKNTKRIGKLVKFKHEFKIFRRKCYFLNMDFFEKKMHEEALFEGQNVKIKIKLVVRYNLLNYEEKNMKIIYK